MITWWWLFAGQFYRYRIVSVGLTAVKQCKMDCVILTDTGSLGISMWRGLACAAIVPVRAKCFPHSGRVKIPLLPPPIFSPLTPILDGQKAESPWLVQECLISSTLPRLGGIKKLKLEEGNSRGVRGWASVQTKNHSVGELSVDIS